MSDIGVEGDQNRVAGRDYLEVNVALGATDKEPLVSAQRKRLNELVAEISQDLGIDPKILWRKVHESVGVESINEITRGKFQEAAGALIAYRDKHTEQAITHTLIKRLDMAATDKGLHQELITFCLHEFGEQRFDALSRVQLGRALSFVDDYVKPVAQEASKKQKKLPVDLQFLLLSYPWQFGGTLLFGVIIGKFWI